MNLQERIDLLIKLGHYLQSDNAAWVEAKQRAEQQNGWFTQYFIERAIQNITDNFLNGAKLTAFAANYQLPADAPPYPKNIGLVMAGNIPLVGFHDWLCIFLSGHMVTIKPSSKDSVLIKHIVEKLAGWNSAVNDQTRFAEMLKRCDAYIATGSNNSARYFEYYFSKYPHIIRRNRTSVALLTGNETMQQLEALADDVNLYFGLGCRNVTKIFVHENYDFVPLLTAFKKYNYFSDHTKYRNNYDYNLALLIMNKSYYMTNDSIILVENEQPFSPISQLHYSYYNDASKLYEMFAYDENIQCIIGKGNIDFGTTQHPTLFDYADGVDTIQFLLSL